MNLSTARELERGFITPQNCSTFIKLSFNNLINFTIKVVSKLSLLMSFYYTTYFAYCLY